MRTFKERHNNQFKADARKRNLKITRNGIAALYFAQSNTDPEACALVSVRPADTYRVRNCTAKIFQAIQTAIAKGKFRLMRYDPDSGLQPYDKANEPSYNPTNPEEQEANND